MAISTIQEAIEDIKNGKMVILVDDEDRENEGDLYIPAQMCTPESINFMAKFGRGLICLALTQKRAQELQIPMMTQFNAAMHRIAITQLRCRSLGQAYVAKRIVAGDTKTEAIRALRRRLSDEVFGRLQADEAARASSERVVRAAA